MMIRGCYGITSNSFDLYVAAPNEPTVYTITFDPNGGSVTPTSVQTGTDGKLASLPTPTRSGSYSFDGWFTASSGGLLLTTNYVFTSNTTVYARWTYIGGVTPLDEEPVTDPEAPLDSPWNNPYSDVADKDWFYDAVRVVAEEGLMVGTGGGKFSPNMKLTRAMIVTILWRLEGEPDVEGLYANFSDVEQNSWYEKAVGWAAKNGIVVGYPGGFFKADRPITREGTITVLYCYAKYKGLDVSASPGLSRFTDMGDISDWALDAMKWAIAVGIAQGRPGHKTAPKDTATRAKIAMIFKRFLGEFKVEGEGNPSE